MALSINYKIDGNVYIKGQNDLIPIKSDSTFSITNAYIKIINQHGNKEKIQLDIGIFDKKDGNLLIPEYYEFIPDISETSKNFIKQGYEYLKTLDKFKDATDLLDEGQTT